jgi:hypothetical protein
VDHPASLHFTVEIVGQDQVLTIPDGRAQREQASVRIYAKCLGLFPEGFRLGCMSMNDHGHVDQAALAGSAFRRRSAGRPHIIVLRDARSVLLGFF